MAQLVRQQQLFKQGLTPKETLDNAENLVRMRQADVNSQDRQIETQRLRMTQEQASVENAKLNLSKVRIANPATSAIWLERARRLMAAQPVATSKKVRPW